MYWSFWLAAARYPAQTNNVGSSNDFFSPFLGEFSHHGYKNKQGVCQLHCGLAIYIKKYLKAKEELWKIKYNFTMQKYIIFKTIL
jgi:hypothetical protein